MNDTIDAVRFAYDARIPDQQDTSGECNVRRHPHIRFALAPYGIEMHSSKSGARSMVPWGQVKAVDYVTGPGVAKTEVKK